MKRSELYFSILLIPLDYVMIVLAGLSAFYIRHSELVKEIRPVIFELSYSGYAQALLIIGLLWLFIFALHGLYTIKSARKLVREVYSVISACSTGFVLIVILIFIFRELFDSRFIILAGYVLAIIYVASARSVVRLIQRQLFRKGVGVRSVVVVGGSKTSEILIKNFSSTPTSGYKVVKRLYNFDLESEQKLSKFLKANEVDELILADPNLTRADVLRLTNFADENHLTYKFAADLLGTKVLKTEVQEIFGLPIVEVKKTPLDGWGRIIKRVFDFLISLTLIVLLSPFLILTALIIKLDSPGPIFYLDYRSGQYGKKFIFYKFRSMLAHLCDGEGPSATEEGNKVLEKLSADQKSNTRSNEPLHKIKDDPRVTRIGKFIRRWSIDELPQLFNVLKGDISLVGPRPHMTIETARYESHHKKVLRIKPGITGLAQISGRSDLSFEEEVKLDTYYIENWSMLRDLTILIRTPRAVIRSRKVE